MIDSDTDYDNNRPDLPLAFPLMQNPAAALNDDERESVVSPSLFDDDDNRTPLPAPLLHFYTDSQS